MALRRHLIPVILFATVSPFGLNTAHAAGDAVIAWNASAGAAALRACMNALDDNDPFHELRMYAMMHIAIHDALNAIDRKDQPYAFDKKSEQGASPDAAVAAAAHDVLVPTIGQLPSDLFKKECIDAGTAVVEASYTAALAAIPTAPPRNTVLL